MKKIFLLFFFLPILFGQTVEEDELKRLGPNGKLFLTIQKLWLKKNHHDLLGLMDTRVRLNFTITEKRSPQSYAAEQAAGILKEHFLEITILKFFYLHKKVQKDTGVAYYQYKIQKNGIIKNKIIYIYLKQKKQKKLEKEIWVINGINQIDCQPMDTPQEWYIALKNIFLEQFKIVSNSFVSVVGSGGKSTFLRQLAHESISLNWPTILTTTTHIQVPFFNMEEPFLIQNRKLDIDIISRSLRNNLLVLIEQQISDRKAKGFSPESLKVLKDQFLVLVEADGSKNKPFRIPATWEPVVPEETTHTILVSSLFALGSPLNDEWVHRLELLKEKTKENFITPSLVAKTLSNPSYYFDKFPKSTSISIYLSACEDQKKYNYALEIASCLKDYNFFYPVFTGNLKGKIWIEKLA